MRHHSNLGKRLLSWLTLSIALTAFLEGLRLMADAPFSWRWTAARYTFIVGLLLVAQWTQPYPLCKTVYIWPWPGPLIAGTGAVAALVYTVSGSTWAAWWILIALYPLLVGLDTMLANQRCIFRRWAMRGLLTLAGGVVPVFIAQIESRFSDEEFFAALQALALTLFWALLLGARTLFVQIETEPVTTRFGLSLDRRWFGLCFILLFSLSIGTTVRAYQHSFYPSQTRVYDGISRENPYLCGETSSSSETFEGEDVFRRLLALVAANPRKGPPEYGMLALGSGEQRWAQAFRESILGEAADGRFTDSTPNVKWGQYQASLRAYYLFQVYKAFPDLFSDTDRTVLQEWFADVNRRALTVELTDWIYALAFSKKPEGPYENQENGAGLLALLEYTNSSPNDSSPINRDYLERNKRGWTARFRNTDDAFIYQPVWLNNAYFQSLYTGEAPRDNKRLSFAWMLLQSLPDGAPLRYNHPAYHSLAGIAYLGARMLEDPRYVWLAGQSLAYAERQEGYLSAQPGVEQPVHLTGYSPTQGSCLLYGDSGLPNQVGPLAPDKIVFRDGWTSDAAYLLLNLRFTGWHRYKATNTIALIYRDGPLIADVLDGHPFTWLPAERSLFRDKRIPRENLNGLLVERSGMSIVLYTLTGVGGPWAQDPPHYARVVAFETGDELDWTHTQLTNWRGWQHDRWIYFYHHGGPIVVVDEAKGPTGIQAALAWHLAGEGDVESQRYQLRNGHAPAEMLLVPRKSGGHVEVTKDGNSSLRVVYYAPGNGRLRVVTLFLQGTWVGADVSWERGGLFVSDVRGEKRLFLPLPEE